MHSLLPHNLQATVSFFQAGNMTCMLGVMSKWLANGCNGSQTAAGKFATVCGHLNAKRINILSILLLESMRRVPFISIKQYCLYQKFISELHLIQKSSYCFIFSGRKYDMYVRGNVKVVSQWLQRFTNSRW